jgi:translation initiation factor IF-2
MGDPSGDSPFGSKECGLSRDKIRLYQLARELDFESTDLVDLLQAAGADVKNHMTAIDNDTRKLAEDLVSGKVKLPPTKPQPAAAPPAPRPAPVPPPKAARPTEIPDPRKRRPESMPTPPSISPEPTHVPAVEEEEVESEAPEPVEASPPPAPAVVEPPAEVPAVAAASEPPPAPKPRDIKPIPSPGRGKIASMDSPSGGSGGSSGPRSGAGPRDRRPARPIISVPPVIPDMPRPVQKTGEVKTQKPVMKLPAEQLRGNKFPATAAPAGPAGPPEITDDEESRRKAAGGAHVGREERQRRRGQRAAERRAFEAALTDEDEGTRRRRSGPRQKLKKDLRGSKSAGPIAIPMPATVRGFSEVTGIKAADVLFKLMEVTGSRPTINSSLTEEEIGMLALAFELDIHIQRVKDSEELLEESLLAKADSDDDMLPRPPVVTFMGHVDHGKTSLMDRIRKANVVASEAGGITQHIGAYQVRMNDRVVTFLDTPGHEAFTAMRARGANVTDIVVLVVASNDGVMPQTEEAINHAKAAEVPIVVAMNKADLPGANFDRVQQQLSQHGLIPDEWGGDTLMVRTAATTGAGMEDLLEAIHTVADLRDLKANPNRTALGNCIEASLAGDRGVQATMLVANGTLKLGDAVLCGPAFGRVRAMYDDNGQPVESAGPSTPVLIYGLDDVPEAGERFFVIDDVAQAREFAEERKAREREESQQVRQHVSLDKLYNQKSAREAQDLRIILKTDVRGSLEAIKVELAKLVHDEVKIKILHDAVGAVNESDVLLADTSDAIIIAFQVVPDTRAESLARDRGVEIRRYNIIYQVSDDIRKAMEGLLIPDKKEVQLGRAVVQETFSISRFGTIAGCRVIQGTIERNASIRVIRDGTVVGAYPIDSLKRHKDDARDVREGLECGIKIAGFNDVKKGDVLEAFRIEEVKRTL